ncbi:hypothetical protein ARMGADRAFT_1093299 [Armillaria gallica]|uniref:Uncharacterized protein n=1 Tax=Armillaria gallica TaxID=47427 RepID=A0A2H3CLL7_ARMGA|nr:hypothetical protein ARMGADRAFT_1093299 [Armillaria gallica]
MANQPFPHYFPFLSPNPSFHDTVTSTGPIIIHIPLEDGYIIELVNISNINDIYAQTGTFSISEPVSSSALVSSMGSASQSGSASANGSASVSSGSASVSVSRSGFASASGSSTRASFTTPSTSSAASTASSSAFNAASRAQVGGADILAAVLAWAVAT